MSNVSASEYVLDVHLRHVGLTGLLAVDLQLTEPGVLTGLDEVELQELGTIAF